MRKALVMAILVVAAAPAAAQTGVYMDRNGNFSSRIDGNGISPPQPSAPGYGYERRYLPPRGNGFTFQDSFGNGMSIQNNVRPACREVVYRNPAGGWTRELSCDPA